MSYQDYLEKVRKYASRNRAIVRKYLAHIEGRRGGRTQSALARQYGMHRQQVHFVLKRAGVLRARKVDITSLTVTECRYSKNAG